ncbi:MAG TPA: rod shape-determining protein MreC [Bacteroidetes bacterium]|nr:rod shape-determining protein MreC [Bacteroidota bacterium]
MFNLIQLFLRLSGLFVFALLEIICFVMVVKYNQTQQGIYLNTINKGTGFFYKAAAEVNHYFSLEDENYRLARENARLLEQISNNGIDTLRGTDTAFAEGRPQYTFTVAKVIKNSVNNHHNYLTLDVGRKDGIEANTGLITNDGVVGVIKKVSTSLSVAMSVLHRQMRISARIKGTNYFGSYVWNEKRMDTRYFYLKDIPKHAVFSVGDTVETSGASAIFPGGLMLGTVDSLERDKGGNSFIIDVKSKLDITNLQYVYVVNNLLKEEQEALENAAMGEDR